MDEEREILKISPLADEWGSSKGGISTLNRELCKGLAQQPNVRVTLVVPKYDEGEKQAALKHKVHLAATDPELAGYNSIGMLGFPPAELPMDVVIGHGWKLGPPANVVAKLRRCKRVHIVHTASEQIAMFQNKPQAIADGEKKHEIEEALSKTADVVVGIGPKLTENIKVSLRSQDKKEEDVLNLTPGTFSEFSEVPQAGKDGELFYTLVFGRGDLEDFELKGYDIAAKAVAGLNDKTYKLVFVGAPEGKQEDVADNLLKCGISRTQLTIRGFRESREKLGEQFSQADLAIMPSRTEGFGLAALEALSAGLPILVSDNSGLGKALAEIPFGTSFVVESDEPEEWGKAIRRIRKKPRPIRLQEARELRSHYDQKFQWREQCAALVEKIRHVL